MTKNKNRVIAVLDDVDAKQGERDITQLRLFYLICLKECGTPTHEAAVVLHGLIRYARLHGEFKTVITKKNVKMFGKSRNFWLVPKPNWELICGKSERPVHQLKALSRADLVSFVVATKFGHKATAYQINWEKLERCLLKALDDWKSSLEKKPEDMCGTPRNRPSEIPLYSFWAIHTGKVERAYVSDPEGLLGAIGKMNRTCDQSAFLDFVAPGHENDPGKLNEPETLDLGFGWNLQKRLVESRESMDPYLSGDTLDGHVPDPREPMKALASSKHNLLHFQHMGAILSLLKDLPKSCTEKAGTLSSCVYNFPDLYERLVTQVHKRRIPSVPERLMIGEMEFVGWIERKIRIKGDPVGKTWEEAWKSPVHRMIVLGVYRKMYPGEQRVFRRFVEEHDMVEKARAYAEEEREMLNAMYPNIMETIENLNQRGETC